MSKLNEGYLCPECFLNLDSEAALLAHFEKKHDESLEQNTVNHVTEYYKDLITGSPKSNSSPKSLRIEDVLNLVLDGNLTSENVPEIGLKPKLKSFLKAQSEKELLISRLSAELESAKQNKLEEAAESQLAELKFKIESYRDTIKNLQDERAADEQHLRSQYNRVLSLEKDLANLTKEYEDLKTEREELKSLLSLDEMEGISFVDQIKVAINHFKSHSPPVSQNVNFSATESADNSDLLTEINSLRAQLANLELEKSGLEEKSKNQESLEQLVMKLEKEIGSLKDQLEEKKAFENQIEKLKSKDESTRNEIQSLKSNIENSNSIIEKLKVENDDLREKIDALNSMEASTQKELESLRSSLEKSNATISEINSENIDLTKKIAALSLEVEEKKQEFENVSNSLIDAQDAVKQKDLSIEALNNEVKKCVSDFEVKSKECDQLTQQIESLNATITQLGEQLQETEIRLAGSLESEGALKTKLTEVEATLTTQQTILDTHENTVAELEAKLASALAENQILVDQIIEGQNKSEQLESALQTTHQERDGFQRIVLELGRQNQAFQVQLERSTNRQWVSDDSAVACTNCNKEFTISIRKHHCRHCGKVFCNACSSRRTATTASRDPQRVCDACFTELTGSR